MSAECQKRTFGYFGSRWSNSTRGLIKILSRLQPSTNPISAFARHFGQCTGRISLALAKQRFPECDTFNEFRRCAI